MGKIARFNFKTLLVFVICFVLLISCREERSEFIEAPQEEILIPGSAVAQRMQEVTLRDGSVDNIMDFANCVKLKWPVTVLVNTIDFTCETNADLATIEAIFDDDDQDVNTLEIQYPIRAILSDHSEVVLNDASELLALAATCNGENEFDADIECIDFIYPLTASVFNQSTELFDTHSFINDKELYYFLSQLNTNDVVNIDFPINLTLVDNTQISVNNLDELLNTIVANSSTCDEDDDFDYSDDDCNSCSIEQLTQILVNECSNWMVKDLTRNDMDLEEDYEDYYFNFFDNNTLSVSSYGSMYYGTWYAGGSGNNMNVDVNIPDLPDCTNNWTLHEIQTYDGETKVDFILNSDRLRYVSYCN